ncbi:MAG: hypothetical protein J5490_07270 [Bacteroidales bacterium]|nr:hypothetical protein [Bacteroidales bacterium]
MKRLFTLFIAAFAALGLVSCGGLEDPFLDNTFVYIANGSGASSDVVSNAAGSSTLFVTLSTTKTSFDAAVEVPYEVILGNGLKAGLDFMIEDSSRSPLRFTNGNFVVKLKITWLYNPSFDSSKDNTLTIQLHEGNLANMKVGDPKLPSGSNKSKFVFTKQD